MLFWAFSTKSTSSKILPPNQTANFRRGHGILHCSLSSLSEDVGSAEKKTAPAAEVYDAIIATKKTLSFCWLSGWLIGSLISWLILNPHENGVVNIQLWGDVIRMAGSPQWLSVAIAGLIKHKKPTSDLGYVFLKSSWKTQKSNQAKTCQKLLQ